MPLYVSNSSAPTAKGALATYSNSPTTLSVSANNGAILQADSTASTGLAWSTPTWRDYYTQRGYLKAGIATNIGTIFYDDFPHLAGWNNSGVTAVTNMTGGVAQAATTAT